MCAKCARLAELVGPTVDGEIQEAYESTDATFILIGLPPTGDAANHTHPLLMSNVKDLDYAIETLNMVKDMMTHIRDSGGVERSSSRLN